MWTWKRPPQGSWARWRGRQDSLFGLLLQDAALRQEALSALDGAAGCWNRKALAGGNLAAGGTCFFWAVGERWTRSPLLDEGDALRNVRTGERLPYAAVPEALAQGRIYPGLFLSFLPLLFARDIRCFGGCFQPEYLRVMRDGSRRRWARGACGALQGRRRARSLGVSFRADVSGGARRRARGHCGAPLPQAGGGRTKKLDESEF